MAIGDGTPEKAGGPRTSTMNMPVVAVRPSASVTRMDRLPNVPSRVGVPEIVPVLASSVRPVGSVPEASAKP